VLNVRKSVLQATFVASVLCIGVVLLQAQVRQPQAPSTAPRAASGGTNVVVIDIGYIFRNFQRFKSQMDDIKREYDKFESYVREQRDALTKKTEQLKALPPGSPEYGALEEQIADFQTKMRLEITRRQKDRVEQEAKIYHNAYKAIEYQVTQFADQYGIDLVVRFSNDEMDVTKPESILQGINRTVVFHRNLNITSHILDALNRGTPPPEQANRMQIPQPNTKNR
jgi:Skp family chaperone for outer membrane proteins